MPSSPRTQKAFQHSLRGVSPKDASSSHSNRGSKFSKDGLIKEISVASPSASILLISPQNRILLLHRVNTSSNFASAHVFPGGHLSPQDGPLPPLSDVRRHDDSDAYRIAAIRECFEESGLLLAKRASDPSQLISLTKEERDQGRKAVHSEKIIFLEWLQQKGCVPDTEGLVPFSRWLTPPNIPKRFSTQMYLYFLPLDSPLAAPGTNGSEMHIPTPDGGLEHTAAQFLYPNEWIDLALGKEIVLFPPQFFLLSLVAAFLSTPRDGQAPDHDSLRDQRERLLRFAKTDGDPPWSEKCISPDTFKVEKGKYLIMGMSQAGPELEGTDRKGDDERVLIIELDAVAENERNRPRPKQVVWRKDVVGLEKAEGKL